MGTASLLNAFFRRLTTDETFVGYKGWFQKSTVSSSVSAGTTFIPVTNYVSYVSGEQLQIGSVSTTVSTTGSGTTIPVNALSAALSAQTPVKSLLSVQSSSQDKAGFVVQEEETDGVVSSSTIPIVLIYTRPGHVHSYSTRHYTGKVVIDCFASSGNVARMMVDQAVSLIHDWTPDVTQTYLASKAYDTSFKTGIQGVKGHRVYFDVLQFVG